MSWNKNTIITSKIDATIDTLKNCGVDFELTEIGRVLGMGLNDTYGSSIVVGDDGHYPIRRLAYKNIVILEVMVRNPDCDGDDHIMSHEFDSGEEPKDWEITTTTKAS